MELSQYKDATIQVIDKLSGFTGIVTGHADYITGCDQYLVQPEMKSSTAEFKEPRWFDEKRLRVTGCGEPIDFETKPVNEQSINEVIGADDNGADIPAPVK